MSIKAGIEKELAGLSKRSIDYHEQSLSDIHGKCTDVLSEMNAEVLSEKTGISKAAF